MKSDGVYLFCTIFYPTFGKWHLTDARLEELLPPGMFHRRGLDVGFGEDSAFCRLRGAKTGAWHWFIYDEYYSTDQNRTVYDHLKEIADRHEWPEFNLHFGVMYAYPSDPANIRIASRFGQFNRGYSNFNIQNALKRVHEGIEHVRWLLKMDANDRPRLVIHRWNCLRLVKQMKTYRWRLSVESGRNPTDARPDPLKRDDHAVDALRYLVFSEANSSGIRPEGVRRTRDYMRYGIPMESRE